MKYYLMHMHNGEAYEDFHEWFEPKIYETKDQCKQILLDGDFIWHEGWQAYVSYGEYENWYAIIVELDVVKQ